MNKQFKAGDKVRCIDAGGISGLTVGNVYEVAADGDGGMFVRIVKNDNGNPVSPFTQRFELVAAEPAQAVSFKAGDEVRIASVPPGWHMYVSTLDRSVGKTGLILNCYRDDIYYVEVKGEFSAYFPASSLSLVENAQEPDAVAARRKLKVGDVVIARRGACDITKDKEYVVTRDEDEYGFLCVHDDAGDDNGLLEGHEYTFVRASADAQVRDFRIRKHGARGEIRGTSYATLEDAEKAIGRCMAGTVYEIVEVQVVRAVKVEQEVRLVDYKEAA